MTDTNNKQPSSKFGKTLGLSGAEKLTIKKPQPAPKPESQEEAKPKQVIKTEFKPRASHITPSRSFPVGNSQQQRSSDKPDYKTDYKPDYKRDTQNRDQQKYNEQKQEIKTKEVVKPKPFKPQPEKSTKVDSGLLAMLGDVRQREQKSKIRKHDATSSSDASAPSPIIAIVGHIDHGKTTLLDTIRSSKVSSGEDGGITQDIGAYTFTSQDNKKIIILDTPGHAVFKNIRHAGVEIADVSIIIISAVEGIQEQTIEAINVCKQHNANFIVAINKIDAPGANPKKIETDITKHGIIIESLGGETVCCNISAKTGEGVEALMENVLLTYSMTTKAKFTKDNYGIAINSTINNRHGRVISAAMKNGSINKDDFIAFNNFYFRLRYMQGENNTIITSANTADLFVMVGAKDEIPKPGDKFYVFKNEQDAIDHVALSSENESKSDKFVKKTNKEKIKQLLTDAVKKKVYFIVHADSNASLDSIVEVIKNLSSIVNFIILNATVGDINENALNYFSTETSDIHIIGFRVEVDSAIYKKSQHSQHIKNIHTFKLIHELQTFISEMIEDIEKDELVLCGTAKVLEIFDMKKIGYVIGSRITKGVAKVKNKVKVLRNDICIAEGSISSIKLLRKDVPQIQNGEECGIIIKDVVSGIEAGDTIECYETKRQS